ncbi:hypothetical protein GIY62_04350 [Burkholderia plantarii]|uniref:hypothetical protein n=1 Tax=Burkholderia plantarii TaxID=41899 RepID=UPI00272CF498|nr:hypothetical protein [Burkholderia plantarii]WLE59905.1 hypothetical protein GIY62_04350 [Burkholderia plantarii]
MNDFTRNELDTTSNWQDLVRSLIDSAGGEYRVQASKTGRFPSTDGAPSLSMYAIRFNDLRLPHGVLQLMSEISTSAGLVDRGKNVDSRNDRTLGAMRQIHANDLGYLPRIASPVSARSKLYEQYVAANKRHTNDRGGLDNTTGYVEYSAVVSRWTIANVDPRIVFDYVGNKLYYSPIHYKSWDPALRDSDGVVDKPRDPR